jgi:hypothetical protein
MESSKTALEMEIMTRALKQPLFQQFNPDEVEKYIRLLLSMKTQTNCLAYGNSRDPKDLAVLFKRF